MTRAGIQAVAAAALAIGGTYAALSGDGRPLLLVNESASAPRGLYVRSLDQAPRVGRRVTIAQPRQARPYLAGLAVPPSMRLLKRVAATGGEEVCASPGRLRTSRETAPVLARDGRGVAMPAWAGCRPLATDELLLLGDTPTSFDGRYFGPVRRGEVEAVYEEAIRW